MRSTRATAAVERLKRRSGHALYGMVMVSGGLFYLIDRANHDARLCAPMPLEPFVAFVNAFGPPAPVKRSAVDIAFDAQLEKSRR